MLKHPFRRLGWLLLLVPLAFGLSRVRFDVEVLNLLPDEVPAVHALKLYQRHFASGRELQITLRAPDAESAEAAARQLAEALRQQTNLVASAVWQLPWLEQPEHLAELVACLWLNQAPEAFAQLTNRLAPDRLGPLLQDAREQLSTSLSPLELARLSYDPLGLTRLPESSLGSSDVFGEGGGLFCSADGLFRVVFVQARGDLSGYRASAAWLTSIRAVVRRCQGALEWPGQVIVRFTGAPAFVAEIASGMERDLSSSAAGTLVLIVVLFWAAHRSLRPLCWLVALLVLVVAGTLAAGGLVFGKLNAVSLGFAAILLGLGVDYGLVLYQESKAAPELPALRIRQLIAPGIWWSAATTSLAFGLLNFAGLPGLSQLGTLIAIGVLLAAVVMLYALLPLVKRQQQGGARPPGRPEAGTDPTASTGGLAPPPAGETALRSAMVGDENGSGTRPRTTRKELQVSRLITVLVAGVALVIVWRAGPRLDHSTGALQPANSQAQAALNELQAELNQRGEPLLLLISGRDENEVAHRLETAASVLWQATTNHRVAGFLLPTGLWPHPERQRLNLGAARQLAAQANAVRAAAAATGFTTNALTLTEGVLRCWEQVADKAGPIWPANRSCQWLLQRVTAWTGQDWLVAGAVYPGTDGAAASVLPGPTQRAMGAWLTGWTLLGEALLEQVEHRLWWLVGAMAAMLVMCLWLAFGRWFEVLLGLGTLAFSLLVLQACMGLAGASWNLMNLMALPLLLGAGVDYTIHVQLALRRHGGEVRTMRRVTGVAVFLCAATTAAGFGSLAWSRSPGLASLGLVCAAGIAAVYGSAVFLLPAWWQRLNGRSATPPNWPPAVEGTPSPVHGSSLKAGLRTQRGPSAFYRVEVWRLGQMLGCLLPAPVLHGLCLMVAEVYCRLRRQRREVVVENLLPAMANNRAAAEKSARELFRQFAHKLADLWRCESGAPAHEWFAELAGWEEFQAARGRGRGVLLLTPHLGNWELGGPLLAQRGVNLLVITQPEPGHRFTEFRSASRARWGIETLVIGHDGFAFVEVIKRLQAGATVALLIDRPGEPSAVRVELFGRPFRASVAAAELARVSGCALLGVAIVRARGGYSARFLPEFNYVRAELGNREARRQLVQQIVRAFEPEIQKHPDQWYHFVPIWPDAGQTR